MLTITCREALSMNFRSLFGFAAALAVVLCASFALAQDDLMVDQVDPAQEETAHVDDNSDCGSDCCEVCCDTGSFFFGAEATFFKYHDANGVEDGDLGGDDTEFDNDANLRLTAGYVGCDGLGARVRYWDYDEVAVAAGNDAIFVDTYTLDFEVFQTLDVGSCTCVEVSGGVRYNDFFFIREDGAADVTAFDGLGGIIGIKAHRDICGGFGVCAGLREVILADDMFQNGLDDETDVIRNVTEIALGVNYASCNWSIHAGYEWQIWSNYVESAGPFNLDREMSDIGFAGFVVGAEYAY
jgi:hypothetical protein